MKKQEVENELVSLRGRLNSKKAFLIGAPLLAVLVVVFGVWQYKQNKDLKKQVNSLQQNGAKPDNSAEVKQLIEAVSKLVVLPTNEEPTIATVTDPSKLADQPFFASAETGDKVLIYANAKKAVIYRPKESRVVDIGPVNIPDTAKEVAGATAQITDKTQVSIKIQNGTKVSGLARKVGDKLKQAGFTQIIITDAPQDNSVTTTITYGEQYRDILPEISNLLSVQAVSQIQIGAADITIVLGSNVVSE